MITIKPVVIPLTHDYVFKAIAKNCPEFLYNLISLITGIDLEIVKMGEFIDTTYIKSTSQYCETDLTFKVNENLIIDFEVCRYYQKKLIMPPKYIGFSVGIIKATTKKIFRFCKSYYVMM